jgi:hypothetical protein
MKKTMLWGLLGCTLWTLAPFEVESTESEPIRYVLATTGLNLRQDASAGSPVLARMPFGAEVRLLKPTVVDDLTVDNIPGGMAQVAYDGETGYAFDGYLSQFPPPDLEGMETGDYVQRLRSVRHDVLLEEIRRDYGGGYQQQEKALVLPTTELAEAFLITKLLHRMPRGIHFPPASDELESTYPNPAKHSATWNDELQVERNERGEVIVMRYYLRGEGGGITVTIRPNEDPEGIRIGQILVTD